MALKAYDAGRVFGHPHGSGAPEVLALHGWGRTGADFDAVLDGLDAIALDLPGFGATPAPPTAVGADGYSESIRGVLEEFSTPPVVVAHSFGGRVAVSIEAASPGTFASMVLTGVPLLRRQSGGRPKLGYRMIRAAHERGLISDDRMEQQRRRRGSADYRAASGVMRDILVTVVNESYDQELGRLDLPVALVWGAEDRDVPLWVAERAAEILGSRALLEVVEGGGHFLPITHPGVIRRAMGIDS